MSCGRILNELVPILVRDEQLQFPILVGVLVFRFHEQPLIALPEAEKIENTFQLLPVQLEFEFPLFEPFFRVAFIDQPVGALVPNPVLAGSVISRGDVPLEFQILDRMVLGRYRKPSHARVHRRALPDRPRFQHPADLQPKIEMKAGCVVLLAHEAVSVRFGKLPLRFRCASEIPFLLVGFEAHLYQFNPSERA